MKAAITIEQEASDNPTLQSLTSDPIIFCTAYKYVSLYNTFFLNYFICFNNCRKQRFYMYSRRLPSDIEDIDRDVFNEKPSKEDIIAVPEGQGKYYILLFIYNIPILLNF